MSDAPAVNIPAPTYRYRGHVQPSAEVSRPAAAYRNAVKDAAGSPSPTSATLDIFDVIDSYGGWWGISARDVDAALKLVGDVDTLYVRVNSPGGEATEGIAIANLLRAHKAEVRVTVYGLAASAASIIAIAGETLSMGPGSMLMVHDAADIMYGDAADARKLAEILDAVSDSAAALYALKAGGTTQEWRAVMQDTVWYSSDAAVKAKLADRVGLDPTLPDNLPPVEEADDDTTVIEIDVEISPAARAAARRFDLSMLPNAPAALAAPQAPAEPPVAPSTTPKEADTMSDTLIAGLRKQLGLPDDADEATVLAANAEALTEAADPPEVVPAATIDTKAITAALEAEGKVVVSKARFDALETQAAEGAQARAKQIGDERDKLIQAAMATGKISLSDETRKVWEDEFARNFDTAKADLESLPARFPVTPTAGYAGHDGSAGASTAFSDDEAGALASLAGVSKEGLLA